MKVAIVGCGIEGSALAGVLAASGEVEHLLLVSRDGSRAEALARRLDGMRLAAGMSCHGADARDSARVASEVVGSDIVVNATLPEANVPVMRAALESHAHYIDMVAYAPSPGTPREETIEACVDLDEAFRGANRLAVPNTGAAPGLTDLAARFLATGFDDVEIVTARWADRSDAADLIPPFTPDQIFSVILPNPIGYVDGVCRE